MNIGHVTAVVSGQSRLGGTKIRIILDIALILHYDSCIKERDTNEYPSKKRSRPFDRSLADFFVRLGL